MKRRSGLVSRVDRTKHTALDTLESIVRRTVIMIDVACLPDAQHIGHIDNVAISGY